MGGEQLMRRIPRIKFPQRHAKSSPSGSISDSHAMSRSDVPAPPSNAAVGGKASLQPKRTPVSEREIEAILVNIFHISRFRTAGSISKPSENIGISK